MWNKSCFLYVIRLTTIAMKVLLWHPQSKVMTNRQKVCISGWSNSLLLPKRGGPALFFSLEPLAPSLPPAPRLISPCFCVAFDRPFHQTIQLIKVGGNGIFVLLKLAWLNKLSCLRRGSYESQSVGEQKTHSRSIFFGLLDQHRYKVQPPEFGKQCFLAGRIVESLRLEKPSKII